MASISKGLQSLCFNINRGLYRRRGGPQTVADVLPYEAQQGIQVAESFLIIWYGIDNRSNGAENPFACETVNLLACR
ncbi:hypothetical protein HYQ46_009325 [Verticillium longisporum]|nr:hypothetical protein HYQ46_009325 [Verticillium longisporum]